MAEIRFVQLRPSGPPIDAESYLAGLPLGPAPADRPYTIANFVMSADGRASVDGRSGPLSDPGDRALFHALRARVDAILAGTGTLAEENYGRTIRDAEARARRAAAGRRPEPLATTVSRSGSLPLEIPLFAEPEAEIVVFAAHAPDLSGVAAAVDLELLPDGSALAEAMAILRRRHGVELLLCEGGPSLFAAMLAEGLIDELFLTLVPILASGEGPGPTTGERLTPPRGAELRSVLVRDDSLFLRFVISH